MSNPYPEPLDKRTSLVIDFLQEVDAFDFCEHLFGKSILTWGIIHDQNGVVSLRIALYKTDPPTKTPTSF